MGMLIRINVGFGVGEFQVSERVFFGLRRVERQDPGGK